MREGRQMTIVGRDEATAELVLTAAMGQAVDDAAGRTPACARLLRYVRPEQVRELVLVLIIIVVAAFFATQIPDYLSPARSPGSARASP